MNNTSEEQEVNRAGQLIFDLTKCPFHGLLNSIWHDHSLLVIFGTGQELGGAGQKCFGLKTLP